MILSIQGTDREIKDQGSEVNDLLELRDQRSKIKLRSSSIRSLSTSTHSSAFLRLADSIAVVGRASAIEETVGGDGCERYFPVELKIETEYKEKEGKS